MEASGKKQYLYCFNKECYDFNNCKNLSECVFNLIIHENENRILFYNFPEKRIFKIEMGKGLIEIDFRDAIREIDIIPTKDSSWKRCKILQLAKDLGFFGINA